MATLLILILLVFATILIFFKKIRAGIIILVIANLFFIGIGNGFVPELLLRQLQIRFVNLPNPVWKNKNALVLLGAGAIKLPRDHQALPTIMAYSRINEAATLYFNCMKSHHQCEIIISGGDTMRTGKSEAVIYQNVLNDLGVKSSNIILEPNSLNTYKNAEYTSSIIKKNHFDQVILITSGLHLRRALLYFSHFGIDGTPAAADYLMPQIGGMPLGYNFAITDFAIHEYMGIVRFHLYNFFGWNKGVSAPGVP